MKSKIDDAHVGMREVRYLPVRELRTETDAGKKYFVGYAALFGVLSQDLGGFKERIKPGAFKRAIAERQPVLHLINHDVTQILGSTESGTTELREDSIGLHFRTLCGTRSYESDLVQSISRQDVSQCSFAFVAKQQNWVEERIGKEKLTIREICDCDLFDISIVARPAYPGTSAGISQRALLFPDGVPDSVRSHLSETRNADCQCTCESCVAGNCENCSNTECEDPNCEPDAAATAAAGNTSGDVTPLRVGAGSGGGTLELLLYSDIGAGLFGHGVTALDFKRQIDAAPAHTKIRLRINSAGGDAFEGIAIRNFLRSRGKQLEVWIDGLAASAASLVSMAADRGALRVAPGAMMMIHGVSSGLYGRAADMRQMADVLAKIDEAVCAVYMQRTGKPRTFIENLMDAETWMTGQDCVQNGFADAIAEPEGLDDNVMDQVRSSLRLQEYRNVPAQFRADDPELARERLKLRAAADAALL